MSGNSSDILRFLPLGLDVRGRRCLVVGGGRVGTRKVKTLLRSGAEVTVVSPAVTEDLAERIDTGQLRWVMDSFHSGQLDGVFFVVAATDDKTVNASVVQHARQRGALVCDASSPERSQVIFGALLQTDDATVAVFTDGRDPAHARRTRDRIARLVDAEREPNDSA